MTTGEVEIANYEEFLRAYRQRLISLRVEPIRISRAIGEDLLYGALYRTSVSARYFDKLATVLSLLIIPCLLGAVLALILKWSLVPFLVASIALAFASRTCQRQAIMRLALESQTAYTFLTLQGIIKIVRRQ